MSGGTGNNLNNQLIGNGANNTLSGGAGDDVLDGKAGKDILAGGTGNDTYKLGRGYGADAGQTTLAANYAEALSPVLAANWQ